MRLPSPSPTLRPLQSPIASLPAPSPVQESPTPTPAPTAKPTVLPTPAVGITPALTPIPTPTATTTPVPSVGTFFPTAPDRDLYELARALLLKTSDPIPRVVNPEPVSLEEGRQDTFWLMDIANVRTYTSEATLRLVSPHAYWYVEKGQDVSQEDVQGAARVFEEEIYPRVTGAFGNLWTPGVDNDPHLTILHARLRGVAGYFSSADEYPSSVHEFSNQREIIYMNSSLNVGSREYFSVLAHELQHAIHWNGDPTEETWINEGLSEVATVIAGRKPGSQNAFLRSPVVSFVNWPIENVSSVHYGASFLFMEYLVGHYGSLDDLTPLVREPLDGIRGLNAYLAGLGHDVTFRDVFRDWTVANFLDAAGDGPYSYPNKDVHVWVTARMGELGRREATIPQYSAEYTAIDIIEGDVKVRFEGPKNNALIPLSLEGGRCWWSNRGDSISTTLTRPLDLSAVDMATLSFRVWLDVEEDWDYGYVEVSADGGSTWDIIEAPGTSPANPVGNSFGPGYTGISDGWLLEEVDLSPYAGGNVLLRFHYVTDDAINGTGLCLDDISVPEVGFFDGNAGDEEWQADGFVSTNNQVPQDFIVQIIEVGDRTRVREMVLNEENVGEMVIRGLEHLDEAVLVVAALAPETRLDASYVITLEPAN